MKVGFLDSDNVHRMKQDKVEKFNPSGSKTSGIPLKNSKRARGGRESRRYRKTARNMREMRRVRRKAIRSWQKEGRTFVGEGEVGALHWHSGRQMQQVVQWRLPG